MLRKMRVVYIVLAVFMFLVVGGCGSSNSSTPIIASSDEEAIAELAQESDSALNSGSEINQQQIEASAVDEVVPDGEIAVVDFVLDGDTIQLVDGRRVRFLQIDAPEGGEGQECYAEASRDTLSSILKEGSEVLLVSDPLLASEDKFDRLLRYVYAEETNINIELVERGAVTVWFVNGEEGIFSEAFLVAATVANETSRGLWGACSGTPFDPLRGADTGGLPSSE